MSIINFNPDWVYNQYTLSNVVGVSLNHDQSTNYCDSEYILFKLEDSEFTSQNLAQKLEKHMDRIFDTTYGDHHDYFFRLYIEENGTKSGYYIANPRIIFSLISNTYYDEMGKKYNIILQKQYEAMQNDYS